MLGYQGGVGAFLTGAATYGIDLTAMTEAAYHVLPGDVVDEAESFREWVVRTALIALLRRVGLLQKTGKITDEQYEKALDIAMVTRPDDVAAAKSKVQFGLSDKVFVVCDSLKRLWRRAHPNIEALWGEAEAAAKNAVLNPGTVFRARRLAFRRDGAWLRMALPSGRVLCYPQPQVDPKTGVLSYMGLNQYSRKLERLSTYGGKWTEQSSQATSADQLSDCMPAIEAAGYPIVFHVHDEIAAEVPDTGDFTHEKLAEMMCAELPWNAGLPLAAAGFETYRNRKG
jgi:DNA polymerase